MAWYKKLPLPGSVSQRVRASSNRQVAGLRTRTQITVRKPAAAFFKKYSNALDLHGYRVKVTTRYQIAKLFGVTLPTITKWERAGVLPTPFMYQERGSRRIPIYLSGQIRCLIMVVNDIVTEGGYVSIPWAFLPDHIAMLHEGYEQSLHNFQRRAGFFKDEPLGDEAAPDKFGVVFD